MIFKCDKAAREANSQKTSQNYGQGDFFKHDNNYDIKDDERKMGLMLQYWRWKFTTINRLRLKQKQD